MDTTTRLRCGDGVRNTVVVSFHEAVLVFVVVDGDRVAARLISLIDAVGDTVENAGGDGDSCDCR